MRPQRVPRIELQCNKDSYSKSSSDDLLCMGRAKFGITKIPKDNRFGWRSDTLSVSPRYLLRFFRNKARKSYVIHHASHTESTRCKESRGTDGVESGQ